MIDVNMCYKIAFDALFDGLSLGQMAEKVRDFIHASVLVIEVTGEIPFYASAASGNKFTKARKKRLTVELYDYIMKKKGNSFSPYYHLPGKIAAAVERIEVNGRTYGYSVIVFKETYITAKDEFAAVAVMISTILSNHWRYHQYCLNGNITMRKRLISHDVFFGKRRELKYLSREITGNYILVYFPEKGDKNFLQVVQEIWKQSCMRTEDSALWVLFYDIVDKKDEHFLLDKLIKIQSLCCVSTLFQSLNQCRRKVEWLRRMDSIKGYERAGGMMLEGEWFAETMYTYARPILKETGLSDYCLQILQEEDKEKNTEFYHTLKMYFLCGHNIGETAAMLHIHRNTLAYRLKRIRELIDMDINNIEKSGELLAFMMMNDSLQLGGENYVTSLVDNKTERHGQIAEECRIKKAAEMICDKELEDNDLDISYCYRLLFSRSAELETDEGVLQNLFEYTGIPIAIVDDADQILAGAGLENIELQRDPHVEYELPNNLGQCVAFPWSRQLWQKAEQIVKITGQCYARRMLMQMSLMSDKKVLDKRKPDYLWLIIKDDSNPELLGQELRREFEIMKAEKTENCMNYLISNLGG